MKPDPFTLQKIVLDIKQKKHLTQKEIAETLGIGEDHFSQMIAGKRSISPKHLNALNMLNSQVINNVVQEDAVEYERKQKPQKESKSKFIDQLIIHNNDLRGQVHFLQEDKRAMYNIFNSMDKLINKLVGE